MTLGERINISERIEDLSETVKFYLIWSKRGTLCPEVAGSIPAKPPSPRNPELKSTFEHIELPAKLLNDFFLRSASNINQYCRYMARRAVGGKTLVFF